MKFDEEMEEAAKKIQNKYRNRQKNKGKVKLNEKKQKNSKILDKTPLPQGLI